MNGSFISGYPKSTNKTFGSKNAFSFTPKIDCGSTVYKLQANISKAFCRDDFVGDNRAEVLINVTGSVEKCEPQKTAPAEKTSKKSLVSSGGGGSGLSKTSAVAKIIELTVQQQKDKFSRGEEFTSKISIKNNGNVPSTVLVYTYAYDGKNCITGSWTANQIDISLKAGETKTISLKNRIEESTTPGEYIFRARAKLGEKNFDSDGTISVTDEELNDSENSLGEEGNELEANTILPGLKIWNDTKLRINLTNCEGCMMEIIGPNTTTTTDKKYRVFDQKGSYNILVTRNGTVLLNQTYDFTNSSRKNRSDAYAESLGEDSDIAENLPTGNFVKTSDSGGFFGWLSSFIKGIFSPIFSMMDSSLSK